MPNYLTTQEVADFLRTPAETIRYWRHVGKGPTSFRIGRRVLYAREEIERFVAEAREQNAPTGPAEPDAA
jgi:excisionase family DNA binding protein